VAKDTNKGKGASQKGGGKPAQSKGSGTYQSGPPPAPARAQRATPTQSAGGPNDIPKDYVPRLKTKYNDEVVPALLKEFNYSNRMQVPMIKKVVINIGMGSEARENAKSLDNAVSDIGIITGQRAVITRAKKSIAAFKLRTGMPIGVMVTLRGPRMWNFLDKLFNVSLARVRDFSGVSAKSFDGHGNYTLGLREQLIFPEIEYDRVDRVRGMEIVIVTSAANDEEGRSLLQNLGMPFKKS
jgi:large subunit ribosomal protein L5